MAATKKTNTETATDALREELAAGKQEKDAAEFAQYVAELDTIVVLAKEVRGLYRRELANLASAKTRAARKERDAQLRARIAELEAAQGASK